MQIGLGISPALGGGGSWSPAKLGSSLLAMWDAERSDLITASSNLVSSWKDVVAGYDMTAATTARPTYGATSFNSRPGLTFDGTANGMTLASVPFPSGANACEMWALVDQTLAGAAATQRGILVYGDNASTARRGIFRSTSTSVNRARAEGGNGSGAVSSELATLDFSGRHVVRGIFSGSTVTVEADGTAAASGSLTPATGTTRVRIGANSADTMGGFFGGVIAVAIVTSTLSAADAARLLAYLKARGGVD